MDQWDFMIVNFNDADPGRQLPDTVEKEGVIFENSPNNNPNSPLRTIDIPNSNDIGLMFGDEGIEMKLPWRADWVLAKCGNMARPTLTFSAVVKGRPPQSATMTGPDGKNMGYVLEVVLDQIGALRLKGGGGEGVLISLNIGRKIK